MTSTRRVRLFAVSLDAMRYVSFFLLGLLGSTSRVFSDAVPISSPHPLAAIQDQAMVAAHVRAAHRLQSKIPPPIPTDWVSQITEMVAHVSQRANKPAEFFGVSLTK